MRKHSMITRAFDRLFPSKSEAPAADKPTAAEELCGDDLFTPEKVLGALHVEVLEKGDEGYYLVAFQGGVFMFLFEKDKLNMMYNDVVECIYSDSLKAALIANDMNSTYSVWSCYLHYATEPEKKPVKVCFSQMIPLISNFEKTIKAIHGILVSVFPICREFRDRFQKVKKDTTNLDNLLNQKDFANKLELAKRLIEVNGFDMLSNEMPPSSHLKMEAIAHLFDDTRFGQLQSVRIIVDDEVQKLIERADMESFDLREYIRSYPSPQSLITLTVIASFEVQNVIINLKKLPGSTNKSLFFSLNVMRSGVDDDSISLIHTSVSFRDTLEVRLTTENEDYWEVKYMLDEARQKSSGQDLTNMTDEQKMLLIQLTPTLQEDLYWGFKYFNDDCLYQSLFYFKRIYYNFKVHTDNKIDKRLHGDISLYIGIVYCRLKRYELAYYYLDHSNKYDSILASEWYVNCLCTMRSPSAYKYIKHMLRSIANNLELDDVSESLREDYYKYYLFLKRRLVQTLISDERYFEAEDLLKQMIKDEENVEFSMKELKLLRELILQNNDDKSENKHDVGE